MHSTLSTNKILMLTGLTLSIFLLSSYRVIGYIGFAIIIAVAIACAKKIHIDTIFKTAMLCASVLSIRFIIQVLCGQWYANTTGSLLFQIFIYFYIVLIRNSKFRIEDWKWIFSKYALIIFFISIYLLMRNQLSYSSFFSSMFGNIVLVGFGIALIMTSLEKKNRKRLCWLLILIVFIYCTYRSDMRSAVVGEMVGIAFSLYSSIRNEGKRFNKLFFIIVVFVCFSMPYLYLELYSPSTSVTREISSRMQNYILRFSSKRMFSGRNDLWPHIINSFEGHQLLGNGIGFNPGEIYNTALSTHNLFFFLRLEQGLVGLFSFMLLLSVIWEEYYTNKKNKTTFYVQGFLVTVLIQQTFSLGLIGGKGAFSVACWTVFIAFCKMQEYKNEL